MSRGKPEEEINPYEYSPTGEERGEEPAERPAAPLVPLHYDSSPWPFSGAMAESFLNGDEIELRRTRLLPTRELFPDSVVGALVGVEIYTGDIRKDGCYSARILHVAAHGKVIIQKEHKLRQTKDGWVYDEEKS